MKIPIHFLCSAVAGLLLSETALAHPITFNSTITYSSTQPSGAASSVAQWSGAAFDAANIGGSGVNADGGADNGAANDASTRVAGGQPIQGQTFTTGSNANGYDVTGITARMAGYTNNTASGSNTTSWNLGASNGPIHATIARINGTTHSPVSIQNFMAGSTGNPGSGSSASGTGTYLTFNLPFPVHLDPNTTYGFDLVIGNGSGNYFEWLGTSSDPYAGGTAYTRTWGGPITAVSGDRVFLVNMTASTTPYAPFAHPGALHTQADFDRMKAKIAAGAEPWKTSYDWLAASAYAQTNWNPYNTDYINRGSDSAPDNYTRSQQDAQAIYQLALRWKLTGNTAYADRAVLIANVWSDLIGISGDTNASLAAGICGYLFATGGEILSTYPGWPAAEKQAYKDMMMRVFCAGNADFLWRHHGTPNSKGGNTHYRLNWDTDNMASMAAIGILCDNKAVYQQAVDYFKFGPGNSRVERSAWYIHPDGTAQTEESGRDQPHNKGGWYAMALLCQMAWNQGDDLFGYDNNRVLRAYEYNAKYNYGVEVPWVYHRNASLSYTETLSDSGRYPGGYTSYELIYNHYANVKGIAAPWNKLGMNVIRPEGVTGPGGHPSAQDHLGLGSLTYARDNTSSSLAPSGLLAQWGRNQVILSWWGSATATSYQVQRAASAAGPYTTLGTATEPNLNFTDTTVANGGSYYYKVVAVTPSGNPESAPLLVNQALVASYSFEGNTNDGTGTRHATAKGGATAPGYTTGFGGGQAISLNGTDQYVQLPVNTGLSRDVTLAAWVYWNGGNAWQRVFDFGSEIEKYMMLTVKDGTGKIGFTMTTSRGTDGTINLTGPTMPTATWTHLAVTFNGETATLYVNGLPVAAGASPRLAPMFSQTFCYLGRSMWNGDAYFGGRIDNFRLYNYGLTGKEIYALWGQGGTNTAPVFSANPMTKPAVSQGVAYTGQSIAATDANGGTLTYSKASGPAWLTVASNGTLSGTPTNDDVGKNLFVVRVTDASGATDDANLYITVSNVNDAPIWTASSLTKLTLSVGQTYLTASLAGDASDVDSLYGDTFTFSKISGPAWLSVASDGTLSGTPGAADAGVNTFTVRVTDSSGAFSNVTLTITVLPASLRAHYDFESNTNDDLGNLNGTITGTAAYAAGRYGNGLVFDGSSTYVTLPANAADCQDITVAAWVNWNGGGANQRIFDFGNGTNQYLFLTPSAGGSLRFAIKNGGAEQAITAPALTTGQWAHVALTLKGGTAILYLNGVPVGVNNAITISPGDFKPSYNYIGKSQWADPLFNGTIDSFRIYNYAVDAAAIQTIAADGATHLTFDQSSGTTALDATGNAWNGTLATGAAWTASGKLGGAVDLNGTGGYVSLPAGIVNGFTVTTIAMWVNADAVGNWQRIFDFGTGTTVNMFLTPKNGTLMRFAITTSGGAGEQRIDSTAGALTTGWHHIAIVLNGSSGTLYLDGVQVGQNTAMTLNPSSLGNTTQNFLGKSQYNDPYFDGRLDDFRIFEHALTAAEISALANTMAAPGSPAITGGNAQVGLTWTAVSGATRYLVKRSTTSGGPYMLVGVPTGTSFTDTGLSNGTTYYYVIAGVNSLGEGLSTAQLSATPVASVAAAPGGVAANGWNGNVQVSWNTSVGAMSYNVLRSTTSGSGFAAIATGVTATSFTDTAVGDGSTYYYVVTATNSGGTSGNSAQASALVTKPRVSLGFDEGTGATATDASGNGWSGTLVNGPLWAAGRAGASPWFDGSNDHATLPTGVVNGLTSTTIAFWADLDSVSTWSRFFDFGTGTTVNMFLTPRNGANGAIRFAITTNGGAGEQKIDGTAPFPVTGWHHVAVTLSGATGTLYVDGAQVGQNTAMTLTPSSLGVTTLNRIGRSQYNDPYLAGRVDEFRIYSRAFSAGEVTSVMSGGPGGLAAPTGVTASAAVGQITVNWTAVTGATGYEVLRSTTSGGPYVTVATNVSGTSNTNAALPSGTTYYYVIVAHNDTSESMNSTEVSASTP